LPERTDIHVDVGGYLLGRLGAAERARTEEHLSSCDLCRSAAAELDATAGLLSRAAPAHPPPPGLEERVLRAVREAGHEGDAASPFPRRSSWLRPALVVGLAAALAAAVFAGSQIGRDELPGKLELEAALSGPQGQTASAEVRETGIGRVIEFRTDELPILPKGEYYELWFVGPRDRPDAPDRISGGTFHPDEQGRSNVRFTAAVDPARYPRLAVTAEPGDGNPAPTTPDVLRSKP
jgi:anti-sigma-K factor RskA